MSDQCEFQTGTKPCSEDLTTHRVKRDGFTTVASQVTVCTQHLPAWLGAAARKGYVVTPYRVDQALTKAAASQ